MGKPLPKSLVLTFSFSSSPQEVRGQFGMVRSFGESAQPLQSVKLSILSRVHGYGQFLATNRECEWRLPSCKLPLIKICWVEQGQKQTMTFNSLSLSKICFYSKIVRIKLALRKLSLTSSTSQNTHISQVYPQSVQYKVTCQNQLDSDPLFATKYLVAGYYSDDA